MRSVLTLTFGALVLFATVSGCATTSAGAATARDQGWVTLLDANSPGNWNRLGDANWHMQDGFMVADGGNGYLLTPVTYTDFRLRVEFWVDAEVNSGVFIRCGNPNAINAANAYEVNIWDQRPDPVYGTGAIVNFAKVIPMPHAAGRWNTYEITARGRQLTVLLNGVKTADVSDDTHATGFIALQHGSGLFKDRGVVKFRKVQIRAL